MKHALLPLTPTHAHALAHTSPARPSPPLPNPAPLHTLAAPVADLHRTLLYGGWAANPRPHLRLVYEANPLAFLVEQVRALVWGCVGCVGGGG